MKTSPETDREAVPSPTPTEAESRDAAPPSESLPSEGGYTTNGNGTALAFYGSTPRLFESVSQAPAAPEKPAEVDARLPVALFCYEAADTLIGGHVARLAAALGRRGFHVQLFTRSAFPKAENVTTHVAGGGGDDLLGGVEEYTRRACSAYLQQFPAGSASIPLVGHEWSSVPAISALRQHAGGEVLLSLHSLERQRSDLSSDLSRRIDDLERAGLRESRAILVHNAEAGEILKHHAPECFPRVSRAREMFPVQKFNTGLNRDAVKGRYQIGPVDPLILFVGNLDERHGADVLMKSAPAILKNHPQAHFVFVGDGDLLWPLRVHARYLLLEYRVRLVGSVEGQGIYDLFQAADVVVVPSREPTEWWPFQAAWAARRPVVVSHTFTATPLERERDCVRIYPHESSCVWGVERVLYDPGLREALTRRGAEKLDERFGWNLLAEQVEELLGVRQRA